MLPLGLWQGFNLTSVCDENSGCKLSRLELLCGIVMSGRKLDLERMNLPSVILASASPRRSELLRQLGIEFEVIPSTVPESESEHLSPGELCSLNAYRK